MTPPDNECVVCGREVPHYTHWCPRCSEDEGRYDDHLHIDPWYQR